MNATAPHVRIEWLPEGTRNPTAQLELIAERD
jgi:hypothetical protein